MLPHLALIRLMSYTGPMTLRELKRAGILFFIPALLFFFPFLNGETYFIGDTTYSFQPWLTYAAQEIQAGHFPLWNPFSACGEPFVGNPQIMLFSPTALLYWIFPYVRANQLFLLLSQAFLFLCTYLLARRWRGRPSHHYSATHGPAVLAALAFAWGGFAVSQWEFPSAIATLPFLPLIFLLGIGQSWTALAAATALAFFTGYTQYIYYAVFLSLAGTAYATSLQPRPRSPFTFVTPFVFLFAAIAAGTLMSVVQILPSWENARQSLRAALTVPEAYTQLLKPIFLIKLWIPWITNPVALPFQSPPFGAEHWAIQRHWLTTMFLGTSVCLLALAGLFRGGIRKVMVLSGVTAVAAVLAFGVDPFFGWARTLIPGLRYLTHFSNASVMGLLCLTLWATEGAPPRRGRNLLLTLVTGTLLTISVGLCLSSTARSLVLQNLLGIPALNPTQDRWVMESGGISAAATLCFAGIWLFFRHKRWAVLWCFTLIELWALGRTFQPTGPSSIFHERLALATPLATSPHRFSISPATVKKGKTMGGTTLVQGYKSIRDTFYPNIPLAFRVHQTWAYEVFGFKEFSEFRRRVMDLPGECRPLDFLGASHIMSTALLPPPSTLLARKEDALLYTRPNALPRVTAVGKSLVFREKEARLDYVFSAWNPENEVVMEEGEPSKTGPPILERWQDDPGRVAAQGQGAGWLVYSGIFFPGWEAYVNGNKTPLARANHAFQAVATPPSAWTVRLIYRPALFRTGLWITLITVLCFIVWIGRISRKVPLFPAREGG
ncbi:MAG: YfhO family protein [Elusimicrobia bacterium]|nr:YfhO family protein [Elusimicrobiota bacterium]